MSDAVDILIFAPHPDDAEVGMGGCILRWRSEGRRVGVVDLTRGETGTKGNSEIRANEAAEATRILDLNFRANLDLGDSCLDDSQKNRLAVVEVIRKTKPRAVFTTCPFDRHPDHVAAAKLVQSAQFLARLPKIETESPAHSVNTLYSYFMHDHIRPTFVIDITPYQERKIEAIRAYKSQFVQADVPEGYRYIGTSDYITQIAAYAVTWGAKIGVQYGEAFHTERPMKVDNIDAVIA